MYIFFQSYEAVGFYPPAFPEALNIGNFAAFSYSPFLIPSAIVRVHLDIRLASLDKRQSLLYDLERSMGIRSDHHVEVDLRALGYSALSKAINSLNSNFAWTMHSCKRTKRLLDFMDTIAIRYRVQAMANGISQAEAIEGEKALLDAHAYLRAWNQGLADRVDYVTRRLQALSQSVSDSTPF